MRQDDDFPQLLAAMRPRLHRYCARMTGSAVDGEDVVQDVLLKASNARARGDVLDNPETWLFRVAHNASIDFLRARARHHTVPLTEEVVDPSEATGSLDVTAFGFRTFLELPVLQRCAIVLKDVLGHTLEEIADIADCSVPAAKSALQRGRIRLRELAARRDEEPGRARLADAERERLSFYVARFQDGDFDAIRRMLAEDVRLDLVARLQLRGREQVAPYFTRYKEAAHWLYALGVVDGRAAVLVYDRNASSEKPSHFVTLEWRANDICGITDFLYAPYVMEGADWTRLDPTG